MNQGAWGLGLENGCGILQSGAGGGAIERGEGRERGAGLEMGEGLGADLRRGWCTALKKLVRRRCLGEGRGKERPL